MAELVPVDHDPFAEGANNLVPVDHDPFAAAAAPGVAEDVGKGIAAGGLRNAPLAAITAMPSIWDLAARGIEHLVNYAAPESGLAEAMNRAREIAETKGNMHRFSDVSDRVSQAGLPDYDPQTTPGKYAKTIAEFVPMALTGNEGAAANVLKGAVAPAVGSEYAGNKLEGTALEMPARIAGAVVGGGLAHGAEAGVNAGKSYQAARSAAGDIAPVIGADVTPGAVARVAKDLRTDAVTPESAASKVHELGPEAMMLDMGRQLQGRGEAIATQPGKGQNTVLDAVEGRTGEFGAGTAQRVRDTLDRTMGESPNVVDLTKRIGDIVDQKAKPLYDNVMGAHPVVNVPNDITSRPTVAQAMKDAVSLAKDRGEQLTGPTETTTILKGPGYHIADDVTPAAKTSLRYWDYVKKAMDHRINGMMKSGGVQTLDSSEKADLGGMIAARNALRDHLDDVTDGAYKTARSVAAEKPQLLEAMEQGRAALNTKLLPEELADMHDNMSIPQQSMLRVGMRREIERIMATTRNDGAAARRALDTDQNREKIATLFGPKVAQEIDNRIAAETKFQDATNKISANSRTGVRRELIKDTETPSGASPPQANLTGFLYKAANSGLQNLRETGMERTRSGIGSLMTTPAEKIPDLVRLLSGYNERVAGYGRHPVGPYAGTLAKVLGLNAVQQASQSNAPQRQ